MGFKDLVLLVKGLNPVAIWMNAPDSLREFVRYSAFVIFYSLTLFVNRPNEETFWLNERLKYLIFHRKIPFDVFPFMMMLPDLVEIEEFWMWMDNVFFSMMYDETVVGAMPNATAIFGVSFLCGGIRIRQVPQAHSVLSALHTRHSHKQSLAVTRRRAMDVGGTGTRRGRRVQVASSGPKHHAVLPGVVCWDGGQTTIRADQRNDRIGRVGVG